MSADEKGYVRFRCQWRRAPAPEGPEVEALRRWRDRLHALGLVGVYPDGIGFGNLSHRLGGGQRFLVSGTATGHLASLGPEHFTRVTAVDVPGNRVRCRGPVRASSESLSHAAVYRADGGTRAVVHVHHAGLWESLRGRIPTTDPAAEAGTPEMALAIERLLREGGADGGLLVMGGHREGLLAFGPSADRAAERVLEALRSLGG